MKNLYCHYRPAGDGAALFKYLSLDRLAQLLSEKTLRFSRADQFIEYHKSLLTPAERKLLQAKYLQNDDHEDRKEFNRIIAGYKRLERQTYMSCWSQALAPELWDRYFSEGDGVVVKSSVERIKNCVKLSGNPWEVHMAAVEYVDPEQCIENMPDAISIFCRKNQELSMEQEVRAVIQIDSKKTNPEFLSLRLHLDDLIDEIIISPTADFEFQLQLIRLLEEFNMQDKIKDSALQATASRKYSSKPTARASYRSNAYRAMVWK